MTNSMMMAKDSFTYYKLFSSMNIFMTLALFFKFARHQERLAIVNKTFAYALPDLMHFFIIFFVVIIFFVMASLVIFGADWSEFNTFPAALLTFFSITINGAGIADMSPDGDSVHSVTESAVIFWLVFKVLIFMIVLNMLLGILVGAYDAAAEEAGDASSLPESLSIEVQRRYKKWMKHRTSAGSAVKQEGDGDDDDVEEVDFIDDDTMGALHEINIEFRAAVGRDVARGGMPQAQLREKLEQRGVPAPQADFLFCKYINREEEMDAGDEMDQDDDDDYDVFEEADRMEAEATAKAESEAGGGGGFGSSKFGGFMADNDGDGVPDSEELAIETKQKLQELAVALAKREAALVQREAEAAARTEHMRAEVAELKQQLGAHLSAWP